MAVARLASEDEPMLRGTARFTADLEVSPDTLHAVFVRSHEAHGVLQSVATDVATTMPGVVAIWTAADLDLAPHSYYPATTSEGTMARPFLASDRVRFVGEPVAMVLAGTEAQAVDAAEYVEVQIDPLPALVDPQVAATSDILLFPEAGTNVVVPMTDVDAEDPMEGASHVIEVASTSPRLTSLPIELCSIVADGAGGRLDVICTGQGVHRPHETLCEVLGLTTDLVRVRHPHVGGGFGGRGDALPEFVVVAAAAVRLRRPIRWVQRRSEQFASMPYGRGQRYDVRLGCDDEGAIVGLDMVMWCDSGAYPHMAAALAHASRRQCTGMYRVPRMSFRFASAVTNTPPVGAYRGAGQPEVNLALEHAVDVAARRLAIDPVEFRRRNLLTADELPHRTLTGIEIDSGDPVAALELAAERIDLDRWRRTQQQRADAEDTVRIGVGFGCYSQTAGSGDGADYASLDLLADGTVTVSCASAGHGQGHHSLWAQMVHRRMGLAAEAVTVIDADTAVAPFGQTTGGSRTSFVLGTQVDRAAETLFEQARLVAADLLEAHPDDIVGSPDGLAVRGVPSRLIAWDEVAARSQGLSVTIDTRIGGPTHPYGTHASVVEVDTETGEVRLLAHVAVDDCGVLLDESSVEGQQHGGAVSGIGPALMEAATWDEDGTPRSFSLLDYLLVTSAEVPSIDTATPQVPTRRNPLGVRGIGENGAIAATPAVLNAALDALAPLGVEHLDIPLAPETVHRAMQA